jgi:GNAT superfamily N-acetyltransferase
MFSYLGHCRSRRRRRGLFRAYIDFYERSERQSMYDRAWEEFTRDERLHAHVAKLDGQLVGIVPFLEHPSTSSADVCYLQDLFTAPVARGQGVGRAARSLYDTITDDSTFTVYRVPLQPRTSKR